MANVGTLSQPADPPPHSPFARRRGQNQLNLLFKSFKVENGPLKISFQFGQKNGGQQS